MNKINLYMIAFAAVLSGSTFLVSCSDDDDSTSPSDLTPTPTIVNNEGVAMRLSSVGSTTFTYDEEGKLTTFRFEGTNYTASGDKLSFTGTDGDETENIDIALNGQGLISKVSVNHTEGREDSEEWEKGTMTVSFSYNSSNQLVGMKSSVVESGYNSYEGSWSYNGSGNQTNTWTDGNLVSAIWKNNYSESYDGEKISSTSTSHYKISYGNTANTSKQYTYNIAEIATDGYYGDALALIGYFGVGTAYLPTGYSYEHNDTEYEENNETGNVSLSYSLNSDGTIYSESYDALYSTIIYYNYVSSKTSQVLKVAKSVADNLRVAKHSKLRRHHKTAR